MVILVIAAILKASPFLTAAQSAQTSRQPAAPSEKSSRTPAQRKINSQLLQEIFKKDFPADRSTVVTLVPTPTQG